jgi:hypothetical protein
LAGQLVRIRDRRVLDEHVEATKLTANARRCGGDRSLICHVELKSVGVGPNLLGRDLAALEITRPNQHSQTMCGEIFCDLKTNSLVGTGDQSYGFVLHGHFSFSIGVFWGCSRTMHCWNGRYALEA